VKIEEIKQKRKKINKCRKGKDHEELTHHR
jgi:hypothetical protein